MTPAPSSNKQKVLTFFFSNPRGRFTPREILKNIGSARDGLQPITDSLKELTREGKVVRLKKNHYALPDRENCVTGKVQAHPDGFGFLIPNEKDREDIYLTRREMRRVMHGDLVMVRVDQKRRGGIKAHIVQVLERGQKRLLGTYEEFEGKGFLIGSCGAS